MLEMADWNRTPILGEYIKGKRYIMAEKFAELNFKYIDKNELDEHQKVLQRQKLQQGSEVS